MLSQSKKHANEVCMVKHKNIYDPKNISSDDMEYDRNGLKTNLVAYAITSSKGASCT
jgi:hypothetical protein